MTRFEFKAARIKLGLSQSQLAAVLHYENALSISALERNVNWRVVPPRVVLLMQAFLDGWRPPHWPEKGAAGKGGPRRTNKSEVFEHPGD